MSDQTKDCEACYGTGNEPRMRSVQPGRKRSYSIHAWRVAGQARLVSNRKDQNDLRRGLASHGPGFMKRRRSALTFD
jgi:hypothetical protein